MTSHVIKTWPVSGMICLCSDCLGHFVKRRKGDALNEFKALRFSNNSIKFLLLCVNNMRFSKNNSIHVLYIPDDADMGYLHVQYCICPAYWK